MRLNIGMPVVRTDGRSGGRYTVTWLPNFLGWIDFLSYVASNWARDQLKYQQKTLKTTWVRPSEPSPCAFPVGAWYSHVLFYAKKTVWPLCVTFVTNKKKTWGRCGQRGDTVLVQTTHSLSNSKRQGWDNNCVPHFNALKGVTSL